MLMRTVPNFDKKYAVVCRMAVPPFFGQFAGYIIVLMTKNPGEAEIDVLRLRMNQLATDIYVRDIEKKIQ